MIAALIIYLTLVVPALLATLRVVNGVLDIYERVRELRGQR
jgi:hypothetical protein